MFDVIVCGLLGMGAAASVFDSLVYSVKWAAGIRSAALSAVTQFSLGLIHGVAFCIIADFSLRVTILLLESANG